MVFGIKRRRQIMRLLSPKSKSKRQREKNQLRAAKQELSMHEPEPSQKQIQETTASRKRAAIHAYKRLLQLRSMKKVLAENPRRAMRFIESAVHHTNRRESEIDWKIAESLLDEDPGKQSTDYVKRILRGMNHPHERAEIFRELKSGVTPDVKRLVERINALREKKKDKKK